MANRHKAQAKGGREQVYGNKEVLAAQSQGNRPGVSATAAKGPDANIAKKDGGKVIGKKAGGRLDRRARGGGLGADKSPFSSARFATGGSVKKNK